MGFWHRSPLVSVVWGGKSVQASNAHARRWLADITGSALSERHPHPHRHIAHHQRRGRLDGGGVRLIAVGYRPLAANRRANPNDSSGPVVIIQVATK